MTQRLRERAADSGPLFFFFLLIVLPQNESVAGESIYG